ncbi:MAG: L-fucose/L-arabinose isomerase family protein [Christensenellales bacterium]
MKLALLIANRGFFPSSVIESARADMRAAAEKCGVTLLEPDEGMTRYGAVETTQEGARYAAFLNDHRGQYDGLIVCLPNFGDENGIKAAIRDAGVPMLLQAYPDEIGKMDFANRRDAFCGKLALASVLKQMDYPYTSGMPFVMHPRSPEFEKELTDFISVCRIVSRMRKLRLGCFGARTTAFKSVRFDEIALERHGVDVETIDLSALFHRIRQIDDADPAVAAWLDKLAASMRMDDAPAYAKLALGKLGAALDQTICEMGLDAFAIRCWGELQDELKIAACSVLGVFNQLGVPAACESDVTNAVAMMALHLASDAPVGCLDLNNNYGSEADKCILFHCGPLPLDLMEGAGNIEEHKMFVKTQGDNCSWGLNVGRIRPGKITISGVRTEGGEVQFYVEEAEVTDDAVESAFFGTSGVMYLKDLQRKLMRMAEAGFRHHTIITAGWHARAMDEALSKYLGYRRIEL